VKIGRLVLYFTTRLTRNV